MICPYCGEEITGAHSYDFDTGICKDHYEEKDLDRFKEHPLTQTDQSGAECNYREWDHSTGQWVPLKK